MNKQGLSKLFKQVFAVTSALFVVVALVRLPQAQPVAPLLGFLLITLVVNARCIIPVPREWWRLSPNESLLLLAMLLFGGEAAIVAAAVTSVCLALRAGRSWLSVCKTAAVTVISTGLLVLILRLIYPDSPLNQTAPINTYLGILCVAVPVHALSRFITSGLAVGFVTVQPRWRAWTRIMLNVLLISFVGAGAAGLCAKLIALCGSYVLVIAAPLAAIGCAAW